MYIKVNNKIVSNNAKSYKGFLKFFGLMFSKKLKENQAIILKNASDIHMFFVFFPIDVVWLDKNRKVVDKKENVKPFVFNISPKKKAYYVLEFPLGKAKLFKLGNEVKFR